MPVVAYVAATLNCVVPILVSPEFGIISLLNFLFAIEADLKTYSPMHVKNIFLLIILLAIYTRVIEKCQ